MPLKTESFPYCCGIKILKKFTWESGRGGLCLPKKIIYDFLKMEEDYCHTRHSFGYGGVSMLMAVLNQYQQKALSSTFKKAGWMLVAEKVYHHSHNSNLFTWICPIFPGGQRQARKECQVARGRGSWSLWEKAEIEFGKQRERQANKINLYVRKAMGDDDYDTRNNPDIF